VREILSDTVLRVTPQQTIEECMRLMTENRVRHLPVPTAKKSLASFPSATW